MKTIKYPVFFLASGACAAALGGAALMIALQPAAANGVAQREVVLEARVDPVCTMTNFDKSSLQIQIEDGRPVVTGVSTSTTVNCNTEIGLSLMSEWGGMRDVRHDNSVAGSPVQIGSFISAFDYVAEVRRNGTTLLEYDTAINPGFGSQEMSDGSYVIAPQDVVPDIELVVNVTPRPLPAGQKLQAADYQDRLTLQISPTW